MNLGVCYMAKSSDDLVKALRRRQIIQACLIGLLLSVLSSRAYPCGVEFSMPKNHFDGVNEWGDVSYWEKVGELDLSQGDKRVVLPFFINFRSSREATSRLIGKSWMLAPLESSFTQLSENEFLMLQPDGAMNQFVRANSKDLVLRGQGNWIAKISDDGSVITAYADCGWKMAFRQSRLTMIEGPNGRKIEFVYSGSDVLELRENGNTLLSVERDVKTGDVSGLSYQGKHVLFEQDQKPRVRAIQGQNLVEGIDRALVKLTTQEGVVHEYSYPLSDTRSPCFQAGDRRLEWDAETKKIKFDSLGNWKYAVTPGGFPHRNAAISRENKDGKTESWFYDSLKGIETTKGLDGATSVKKWFVSGKLAGKLREEIEVTNGVEVLKSRLSYGESGQMIRRQHKGSAEGVSEESTFDSQGRLSRTTSSEGVTSYFYDEFGRVIVAKGFTNLGEYLVAREGELLKRINETYNITAKDMLRSELAIFLCREARKNSEALSYVKKIYDPKLKINTELVVLFSDPLLADPDLEQHIRRLSEGFPLRKKEIETQIASLKKYRENTYKKKH